MLPMAMASPARPKNCSAMDVASAAAPMLARVMPTSSVVSSSWGSRRSGASGPRLLLVALGELLEPRPPEGEVRGLGAGEERRAEQEHHEPGDLGGEEARHRKCS